MPVAKRDHGLDTLLAFDGVVMVISENPLYWVKFKTKRVEPTPERQHGINYSLTLHGPDGKRVIGYDNAHAIQATRGPGGKRTRSRDHCHRHNTTRPYEFVDAGTLMEDFWKDVTKTLEEFGVAK